jgi:hypothetical protein
MKRKKAEVERPAVDRMADANVKEVVRQIEAERPKQETLADKVKQVLSK